jgi:molecular chaperone HscB
MRGSFFSRIYVMSSILTRNHFELLSLPERYQLDRAQLDANYRELQRSVHPDRFASASDQARRLAVQRAAQINEAFATLKDPLQRGMYLLGLRGVDCSHGQTTHQDAEFLMQQIELREQLAEVRTQEDPLAALDVIAREVRAAYTALERALGDALDSGGGLELASTLVLKMQFFTRLNNELSELEADLEDELY